jgi:hypothetical protein
MKGRNYQRIFCEDGKICGAGNGDDRSTQTLETSVFVRAIALMMEAISTFETSVNFYHTTLRNIPADSRLRDSILLSSEWE